MAEVVVAAIKLPFKREEAPLPFYSAVHKTARATNLTARTRRAEPATRRSINLLSARKR